MTRILRLVAFAIAVAGVVDPAISVSGATRARVAIVAADVSPAADGIRDRLTRDLSSSYDVVSSVTSDAAAAIVIGDAYPRDFAGADALLVSTVTLPAVTAGAHIVRVDAPEDVPPATVIHLDVEIESARLVGQTTDVAVEISGLEAGRASHRWTKDAERWRAGIDVVPIGEPPYVLRVRLKPDTTDTPPVVSGFSRTRADVVVDARHAPFRVEFYEPRPSWAATFVRRALESDPRFQVATLSFTSRGVSAQTGAEVPLSDPRLDRFDVVIVGGLDRLTIADVRSLDRFMRERGGAVAVLPDQRIDAGAAHDFTLGPAVERLLEQPAKLTVVPPAASIQASELLVLHSLTPGADVVARVPGGDASPVIVSTPRGDGRLLFSGAMDAWRFRAADGGAFDRFWQSTIAGLALTVPPPIAIRLEPPLLRPGERGEVVVRLRSQTATSNVAASIDGDPIRLRPEPEAGLYRGTFTAKREAGRSTIDVRTSATRPVTSRTLLVQPDVHRVRVPGLPPLAMLASSHRGIDVTPERVAELERFIRGAVVSSRATVVRHPMRSTWWMLPFAVCLSAEWWIRRRKGHR